VRHYEIVFLIHSDQSDQVPGMIEHYTGIVKESGGFIHRLEDWGRRQLAYPVRKVRKAHYVLMNLECSIEIMRELESLFRFNEYVLRHLIMVKRKAVTGPSPVMLANERERAREKQRVADEAVPEEVADDNDNEKEGLEAEAGQQESLPG